ncbi:MAG: diacylglycerol kinase family protein [Endomicrobiales bacterium]|jgi:diacylglycerol kinase (ATP)
MDRHYKGYKTRIDSFMYAFSGIRTMLVEEPNAWIHAAITVIVIIAGFYCKLTMMEWCWIVLSIVSVWTAEALNTAFESLADVASPKFHPMVEKAKDVAAGAVLITSIGSAIVGLLVLGPHFFHP